MTVYYASKNINGFVTGKRFSIDAPCVTIMAHGMGGDHWRSWQVIHDGVASEMPLTKQDKPPYRVPLMSEIRELEPNGFLVADLFSGAGGSCTGFRMAGFKVGYACEFVPIAQESYKANSAPDSYLDCRDVKLVQPQEILDKLGIKKGDLDVLSGSPPCQAFSTAGKREKGWGKDKTYEHGAKQKNETLFSEYIRLLRGLMPKAFVAENVSGLVKGVAKGYFLEILKELKASGYRVTCKVLDAQWLGVPQTRQRTIFVGVRNDLNLEPAHPTPLPYRYTVRDAIPWIVNIKADQTTSSHGCGGVKDVSCDRPLQAVTANGVGSDCTSDWKVEARVIHDTSGTFSQGDVTDKPCPAITNGVNGVNGMNSCHFKVETPIAISASRDDRGAFGNGGDITDAPAPAVLAGSVGTHWIHEAKREIEPETDISKFAIGDEWDKTPIGGSNEKFFNLKRAPLDGPSQSITAMGGTSSAAGVTHPTEKRKFTIDEVKRICSFPDDFILVGKYAQQWERLGKSRR